MDILNQYKLSVIIPCFNEEKTIQEIINRVQKNNIENKELIIVDDFSNDKTRDILKNLENENNIKIIYNEKNLGKGFCLRKGFQEAKGEIIIIQDADLEYDPNEHLKVVKPIMEGAADVVYGSRFIGGEIKRVSYFWHKVGNIFLTNFCNIFTNLSLTDMETCYKAFKKKDILSINLEENRFGIEPEITIKLAKKNLIFYEVGISYYGRSYSEGKKISWVDGLLAIKSIIKHSLFSSF